MRAPILHIAPFLWSGAGGVITRLCEEQRRSGPVTIVTTSQSGRLQDWREYRQRLRRIGVTHHTIDFFHRNADGFWNGATTLADLVREQKPGVIHAHAGVPACGAVVARAMSGSRARIIGQMYSWGPDRPEWMNRQDAWGLSQTDRVVCSARAYWDLLVQYGVPTRKLVYVPWGLPLDRFPPRGTEPGADRRDRGPAVGFVGRIEPRKGQLALVDAFARFRKVHPTARLDLVGPVADPVYVRLVRDAIVRHDLGDAVRLTGRVRDVTRLVRQWDLFVSLSADEGQGLAVLEAMALGVPVVARPVAGIADYLVDGRTGIAVNDASARTAAAAMRRALEAPARAHAMARRARRLVERRYSWDLTLNAFDRLYWR